LSLGFAGSQLKRLSNVFIFIDVTKNKPILTQAALMLVITSVLNVDEVYLITNPNQAKRVSSQIHENDD